MGTRLVPERTVIPPEIARRLEELGFSGKGQLSSAIRFLKTNQGATGVAGARVNNLRATLEELALKQPFTGYTAGRAVELVVCFLPRTTYEQAAQTLTRMFSARLGSVANLTFEPREGGTFQVKFNPKEIVRLRRLERKGDKSAAEILENIRGAQEAARVLDATLRVKRVQFGVTPPRLRRKTSGFSSKTRHAL